MPNSNRNTKAYNCIRNGNKKLSSLCIDETLQNMRQDDPKLIKQLKDKYIYPPSHLDYNFTSVRFPYNSNDNKLLGGEHQEAVTVEKKLLQVTEYRFLYKSGSDILP